MIKGETSALRIRSYTTGVYGRIAPCEIAYDRTRLSQLYNLMNSKYFNQWRREGVKAGEGGDRSKWEEGRKCLLHRMPITFFGKFSIFCPKFSGEVPTEDFFFSSSWFFSFLGGFPVKFCPKIRENELLHFRKQTPKREKA